MTSQGWGPHDGINAIIIRDTRELVLSPSPFVLIHKEELMWGHSDKEAVYKPGGKLLPEPNHTGTLDFEPV